MPLTYKAFRIEVPCMFVRSQECFIVLHTSLPANSFTDGLSLLKLKGEVEERPCIPYLFLIASKWLLAKRTRKAKILYQK